jgi:hypothetical protein
VSIVVAIPGSPTAGAPLPDDEPATAHESIRSLAKEIEARELFGFLTPSLRARCEHGILTTWCAPPLTRSAPIVIAWRWSRLWTAPDWYEVGWHPDRNIHALARDWPQRLWQCLNPGKSVYVYWGRQ